MFIVFRIADKKSEDQLHVPGSKNSPAPQSGAAISWFITRLLRPVFEQQKNGTQKKDDVVYRSQLRIQYDQYVLRNIRQKSMVFVMT